MTTNNATETVAEIIRVEQERCRAWTEGDWAALDRVLADDYTHTHVGGRVDERASFMEFVKDHPVRMTREDLKVRLYGDVALLTGVQNNTILRPTGDVFVKSLGMQVLVKGPAGWRIVATQVARIG